MDRGTRFLPTFLKKSGRPQQITKRADYIPKTSEALQPENCVDLVMCEITKAPEMKLQSALKSASAAFSWWMADANSSCEISERRKRRHRRKQNAKGWKKQMPNCLQRLQPRRNLDQQITTGTRQISRDMEIWSRNLKHVQIILGQITRCNMVFPSMEGERVRLNSGDRGLGTHPKRA